MIGSMEANAKPVYGFSATRSRDALWQTLSGMGATVRKVLAANLNALMRSSTDCATEKQLRARTGLGGGTVDGARQGTSATSIDSLEKLARAFGLRPYQLLIPDLDPRNPASATLPNNHREFYEHLQHDIARLQEQVAEYQLKASRKP